MTSQPTKDYRKIEITETMTEAEKALAIEIAKNNLAYWTYEAELQDLEDHTRTAAQYRDNASRCSFIIRKLEA